MVLDFVDIFDRALAASCFTECGLQAQEFFGLDEIGDGVSMKAAYLSGYGLRAQPELDELDGSLSSFSIIIGIEASHRHSVEEDGFDEPAFAIVLRSDEEVFDFLASRVHGKKMPGNGEEINKKVKNKKSIISIYCS